MDSYKKLEKRARELSQRIETEEARLSEARARVKRTQGEIENLFQKLKSDMLAGKGNVSLNKTEEQLAEYNKAIIRDTALIDGLTESLPGVKLELESMVAEKNSAFATLADRWLKREIAAYDSAIETAKRSAGRLLCSYKMLREINQPEIYQAALGDAFTYLPGLKFMQINGFDKEIFISKPVNTGGPTIERAVADEIAAGESFF